MAEGTDGGVRDPAFDELVEAYARRDLVLFVGAGLSTSAGLPSKAHLVEILIDQARGRRTTPARLDEIVALAGRNLPEALSALKLALGASDFCAAVERALDDHRVEVPDIGLAVAALAPGLRALLTTNLDHLLERACQGYWRPMFRATGDLARRERVIIKLHGTLIDHATWILTHEDHERAMYADKTFQPVFSAMFHAHTLLFVGYDPSDTELTLVFERLRELCGGQSPRHYALVPEAALGLYQTKALERRGLCIIPCGAHRGASAEVAHLLRALAGAPAATLPSSVAAWPSPHTVLPYGARAWPSPWPGVRLPVLAALSYPPGGCASDVVEPAARAGEASESPFPGLSYFEESRAPYFFGRETEVAEALGGIGDTANGHRRWLQIEGPSGAGKSSLARAGVIPQVRLGWIGGAPRVWRVAILRPGPDPLMSLAQALQNALANAPGEGVSLDDILARLQGSERSLATLAREGTPEGEGLLLVVDQLEEAFKLTPSDSATRGRFDTLLAHAIRDKGGPVYLVTTIRSDFVGRFGELPALERLLNSEASRYHLTPISALGLRRAIEEPARLAGLVWESGLVERILADASPSAGGLPLVAHVLASLWASRRGDKMLHAAYSELGGVGGAVAKSADAIVNALGSDSDRDCARKLLLRLVKIGRGSEDTRQTVTRKEALIAAGGGGQAERVLARLSGGRDPDRSDRVIHAPARLVVVGYGEEPRVDLVHEALLRQWETLKTWIQESRKGLERRDDLEAAALAWKAAGELDDSLPFGGYLDYLRGAVAPSERASSFLALAVLRETDQKTREAEQRQLLEAQTDLAERRLADAIDVADKMVSVIARKLELIAGAAGVRRELLEETAKLHDSLLAIVGDSASVLRRRMVEHLQRGDLAKTHKHLAQAREEYEAGLTIARRLVAMKPQNIRYRHDLSFSCERLGEVARGGGDLSAARAYFEESLELRKSLSSAGPSNASLQRDLAVSYNKVGDVSQASGDLSSARGYFEKGLELLEQLSSSAPSSAELQRDLSVSYTKLGEVSQAVGNPLSARGYFERSLELVRSLSSSDPRNAALQRDLAVCHDRLGAAAQAGGDLVSACGHFEESLKLFQSLSSADLSNASLQRDLSVSYERLGAVSQADGKLTAARDYFSRSLELRESLSSSDPRNAALQRDLSVSYTKLGAVAQMGRNLASARDYFEKSLELFRSLSSSDPSNVQLQLDLALCYVRLADVAREEGDSSTVWRYIEAVRALLDGLYREGKGKGNALLARIRAEVASFVREIHLPHGQRVEQHIGDGGGNRGGGISGGSP